MIQFFKILLNPKSSCFEELVKKSKINISEIINDFNSKLPNIN